MPYSPPPTLLHSELRRTYCSGRHISAQGLMFLRGRYLSRRWPDSCSNQGGSVGKPRTGEVLVKVVCAWCEQEGQPAILGERAPLLDDRPTHGICRMHLERYLLVCEPRVASTVELLDLLERDARRALDPEPPVVYAASGELFGSK